MQWLRKNKDKFKMPVHEPARLNVFSKTNNPLYCDIIEGPISINMFKVIIRFPSRDTERVADLARARRPSSSSARRTTTR